MEISTLSVYFIALCCLPSIAISESRATRYDVEDDDVSPVTLKLVGGDDKTRRGRVDMKYRGRWGTMCVRDMDRRVAAVICRMMGHKETLSRPADGKVYRKEGVQKPFWVVNGCNGTESSIAHCGFIDIKNESRCEEIYDHTIAGVDCDPMPDPLFSVRLVNGGSPSSGVVEVTRHGRWGTICGKRWSEKEAKVVCRRLGFPTNVLALTVTTNYSETSSANRDLILSGVECTGEELTLRNCIHRPWGDETCVWGGRAAVDCEAGSRPLSVRLVGGRDASEGWAQVRILSRWADLLSSGWSGLEATVVCQKLGYWWGSARMRDFNRNALSQGSWVSDITCKGGETDLSACANIGWIFSDVQKTDLAAVSCYDDTPQPPLPIITGNTDNLTLNSSVKLVCKTVERGKVSIRWVCQGDVHITRGPLPGSIVSLGLEIPEITAKHNNLNCMCHLTSGRGWSVSSYRRLNVTFDPASVDLVQQNVVKDGEVFGFECHSALSNPAATLRWLNGTREVSVPGPQYTKAFPSGIRTYQRWFVRASDIMTGRLISCVAQGQDVNSTAFDSVVLVVGTDIPEQAKAALAALHVLRNPSASVQSFIKGALRASYQYRGA